MLQKLGILFLILCVISFFTTFSVSFYLGLLIGAISAIGFYVLKAKVENVLNFKRTSRARV